VVDAAARGVGGTPPVPGRRGGGVTAAAGGGFYVNIRAPPQIVVIDSADATRLVDAFPMTAAGPHGLDLDPETRRLFCACDGKTLLVVDLRSGAILSAHAIGGGPGGKFFKGALPPLYVPPRGSRIHQ